MAITDELREWVVANLMSTWSDRLIDIADHIDEEYAEAQHRWMAELDAARDKDGWIQLPVDAEGMPIHIGDVMNDMLPIKDYAEPAAVDTIKLCRDLTGWLVKLDAKDSTFINPMFLCHHKETVEDVLKQFAVEVERAGSAFDVADNVWTRFATKLRLADDGEEQ